MLLLLLLDKKYSKREVVRGCVADFCPACRSSRIFKFEATEVPKGGPFRQRWVDTDQRATCKTCNTRLWVGDSFTRFDDSESTLNEVIARTNPGLPRTITDRQALHEKVRTRPLDMTLKATALRDAFESAARMVKPEPLGTRIGHAVSLLFLLLFPSLPAALWIQQATIARSTGLSSRTLDLLPIALYMLLFGASMWATRAIGRLRRRRCHRVAGALLAGLNVTESELRDAAQVLRPEFSNMLRCCSAGVVAQRMMQGVAQAESASPRDGVVEVAA